MSPIPRNDMMDAWTPTQILAVYDFCQLMSDTLWNRYQNELITQLLDDERGGEIGCAHRDQLNLELTRDDSPPF